MSETIVYLVPGTLHELRDLSEQLGYVAHVAQARLLTERREQNAVHVVSKPYVSVMHHDPGLLAMYMASAIRRYELRGVLARLSIPISGTMRSHVWHLIEALNSHRLRGYRFTPKGEWTLKFDRTI